MDFDFSLRNLDMSSTQLALLNGTVSTVSGVLAVRSVTQVIIYYPILWESQSAHGLEVIGLSHFPKADGVSRHDTGAIPALRSQQSRTLEGQV
jgi:hypothetical protein